MLRVGALGAGKMAGNMARTLREMEAPKQITGYEYEVEVCRRALEAGALECPEMPHAQTLRMMEQMDALRRDWGVRYPFE